MNATRAYWITVGKAFEDLAFLKSLKEAQLKEQDLRQLVAQQGINLTNDEVSLLLEKRNARNWNILDIIFAAKTELGTDLSEAI